MFNFLKSIFVHKFSIINKYNIGDICFWPSIVDSMVEPTVKIISYNKYFKDNKEFILYNGIDIYTNKRWNNIPENEINLLATADEMFEMNSYSTIGVHLFS